MEQSVAGMAEVEGGRSTGEGSVRARVPGVEESRERLFRLGAVALTDSELLGLLWGAGARATGGQDAATALLARSGGLKALTQEDPLALCSRLGPARAAQLLTALELTRRVQRTPERRPKLRNPRDIHAYLAPTLASLRREVFHVLCFNARNVLVHDARVAEGTMNTCPVDPREVFAAALTSRATGIVLAHNHPSGDPEPSVQDIELTRQLAAAAGLLNIKLLDHVVVGDAGFVSLMERGVLPDSEREVRRRWSAAGRGS